MNRPRSLNSMIGVLFCLGVLIGVIWANYRFAQKNISGEGFLIQWTAIHALVKDGNSPYSDQVSQQIQQNVKFQNSFTEGTPALYTSPLFSGIIILPFALIENSQVAHTIWLTLQMIAIFSLILVSQRITGWKPGLFVYLLFLLLTFFSYHVIIQWLDGGLSIWAAFFIVLVFVAIRNNWNELGGFFLALSAIQPQMTILVILFTLIWAATQRRRVLIAWFFITVILLSVVGTFIVPDWIMQYLHILFNGPAYFPPGSPSALFSQLWPGLGKQLGWLLTAILVVLLLVEGWVAVKKGFRHYLWAACLIIVITQWIGLPSLPANFVGLLPPLILIIAIVSERWPKGGQWAGLAIVLLVFAWEWYLFYRDILGQNPTMQLNLLIPLPLVLLLGLYWVKWAAIRPQRLLLEELKFADIH